MIFQIKISWQAEYDIRSIYEYIAFKLESPRTAKSQLARLEESIKGLNQMPERFRKYENEPWYSRGLRIMPVDNYCVFYIPDMEKVEVTVIRVMYSGRDTDKQLEKYTSKE